MGWKRLDKGIGRYKWSSKSRALYIWCSGSHGKEDWIKNFSTGTVSLPGCAYDVNEEDYEEAMTVYRMLLHQINVAKRIAVAGFSRGGAVASILTALLIQRGEEVSLIMWAPKRSGLRFSLTVSDPYFHFWAWAQKGDVVPFFPLRYPSYKNLRWRPPLMWPWKAHKEAAKRAALWRERIDRLGRDIWKRE